MAQINTAGLENLKDIIKPTVILWRNNSAARILQPNGILLTTSCSLHLSRDMLLDVLRQLKGFIAQIL